MSAGGGGARPVAAVRAGSVVVDGIRSPLLEAGPPDAPEAVVFLHGNPGSSADWGRLVSAVGVSGRAVAVDQPGFGRADKPPTFDHSYDGHAAHLARTLDALGIRRAHLVGHDLGGRWGLELAAAHPDRVGGVVLIGGGVLLDYRWHYLARLWRRPVLGNVVMAIPSRALFRLLLRRGNPRGLPRAFLDRMYDDMDGATRQAILSLYRPGFDWDARSASLARRLAGVPRPALVVWGRADPYIGVAQAWRQRESLPSAEVVVLDRSGHWPFVDDPDAVERVVVPFLAGLLGAEAGRGPVAAGRTGP